ncbi:MAG: CidA/LrgA family protein [Bacteroidota bacterium]|nr:CidA/LrgA family protein [Bacteroidota bacterium]MDP4204946.1 CidA/LrgA family protein [Bacteroidota bacterium]
MKAIKQITIILAFWLAGEAITILTGLPVPGSIIGMIMLVATLELKWIKVDQIEKASNFLIENMAMFFIPAGVGTMCYFDILRKEWLPISVSVIVSIFIVMAVVGLLSQSKNKNHEGNN